MRPLFALTKGITARGRDALQCAVASRATLAMEAALAVTSDASACPKKSQARTLNDSVCPSARPKPQEDYGRLAHKRHTATKNGCSIMWR